MTGNFAELNSISKNQMFKGLFDVFEGTVNIALVYSQYPDAMRRTI